MRNQEYLSDDGLFVLVLCSNLVQGKDENAPAPFTLKGWNELSSKIENSEFKRPSGLQGQAAEAIKSTLQIAAEEAERIVGLLDRAGDVQRELEALVERGIWAVTRADEKYPAKLANTLKHQAPTVLFGAGRLEQLANPGIAIVGSRNLDERGANFAREIGRKAAEAGMPVVSGGARGTDRIAMEGGLAADGTVFGVLADSLDRTVRQQEIAGYLAEGKLVLLTPYAPSAGFSVGAAMGRNKVIYGLAEYAVVAASEVESGGTWAGAVEALKARWCPVFVRDGENVPKGNKALIERGGISLPETSVDTIAGLPSWMREHAPAPQTDLFGIAMREEPPPRK